MQIFKENDNFVIIQKWKDIFYIQSSVLLDKHFHKMNDDLPLKPLHPRIISMFYNANDKPTLSYFMVQSLFELLLNFITISKFCLKLV